MPGKGIGKNIFEKVLPIQVCFVILCPKAKYMTTLNFKRQDDNRKVYINPLARNTAEGDVMKVSVYVNENGSIASYDIKYKEGHAFLGGREETVKELPSSITLID